LVGFIKKLKVTIMTNRIILSMLFLSGMLCTLQGQGNPKDQRLLHINARGEVLDQSGTQLGYISKEDVVFNAKDQKLGFIRNGMVYDVDGKSLGKARKNGRYINFNGVSVLRTKSRGDNCEILDPEGHKMGTVHKNYKLHACAVHCFFKQKELDNHAIK
jgi:hypothetical protein